MKSITSKRSSTLGSPKKEIVQIGPTMFVGVPMTGRRVSGVGREILKTPRMQAFARLV